MPRHTPQYPEQHVQWQIVIILSPRDRPFSLAFYSHKLRLLEWAIAAAGVWFEGKGDFNFTRRLLKRHPARDQGPLQGRFPHLRRKRPRFPPLPGASLLPCMLRWWDRKVWVGGGGGLCLLGAGTRDWSVEEYSNKKQTGNCRGMSGTGWLKDTQREEKSR